MSTIKSSAENLTLNADGANNDIIFQSNGSNVATLDQAGLLTATTFAGSGASLTSLPNGLQLDHSGTKKIEATADGVLLPAGADITITAGGGSGGLTLTNGSGTTKLELAGGSGGQNLKFSVASNTASYFTFHSNTGEQVRITDDGLTFNGDTAAANALDDYEEGTYQPTLTGATSGSFNTAAYTYLAYTKIGRVVHIQGYLNIGSESSCVGSITMSLPFTCSSSLDSDSENAAMTVSLRDHGGSGLDNITGTVATSGMRFVSLNGSGGDNTLDAADVDTSWNIRIGGSYIAA